MKNTIVLALKGLMLNQRALATFAVGLWFVGMLTASLSLVVLAAVVSIILPSLRFSWHKAYKNARVAAEKPHQARLAIANAI